LPNHPAKALTYPTDQNGPLPGDIFMINLANFEFENSLDISNTVVNWKARKDQQFIVKK
jgi:hypothetical protein